MRAPFRRIMDEQNDLNSESFKVVRIGHSPDPDDAFMFHALTSGLISTPGYHFVHELQDIETLNQRAMNRELEVSAISIHSFPEVAGDYALMNCGASMGEGYGPMVVAKSGSETEEIKRGLIAVPGLKTSAYLGLRMAWGDVSIKVIPFDEIIEAVNSREVDGGLIIHEGQLTYVEHELDVHLDLGVWWSEHNDGLPLPLGGNIVRKDLGRKTIENITNWTRLSIIHALENPEQALEFAKAWGRGIDDQTNEKFVKMYVNERTIDYGDEGREAIRRFLKKGQEIGMVSAEFEPDSIEFIGRSS